MESFIKEDGRLLLSLIDVWDISGFDLSFWNVVVKTFVTNLSFSNFSNNLVRNYSKIQMVSSSIFNFKQSIQEWTK